MTKLLPIERMRERIQTDRDDSDASAFLTLLCYGEMVLKLLIAALIAGLEHDRNRYHYRCVHRLVRASGLGEWLEVLQSLSSGPAANSLLPRAMQFRNRITEKASAPDSWQRRAGDHLRAAFECLRLPPPEYQSKISAFDFFTAFVRLRNKTRGHGAQPTGMYADASQQLEEAIQGVVNNLEPLSVPWAYLHRNLSGKYRVTAIGGMQEPFNFLKSDRHTTLENGVYIALDDLHRVELMRSGPDRRDFFFPNGSFTEKTNEWISYITGDTILVESSPFLLPAEQLPESETHGLGSLDVVGEVFTNVPALPSGYITRHKLEEELSDQLQVDRHPIVSLNGPGGIGKTLLALRVIHQVLQNPNPRYNVVLWFSARDIDLQPDGPKHVRPGGLDLRDFGRHFVRLMGSILGEVAAEKAEDQLAKALGKGVYGPTLFVFDNFETVTRPGEVFKWLDTYVREPNKVLITTRIRGDFQADYPVRVGGMSPEECAELIDSLAGRLGVRDLLTSDYMDQVTLESDGHPYVIRILLGEVARTHAARKLERIVAPQDDLLRALFERTYAALSPAAQRIFLTLSSWRSTVPVMAIEAVLLHPRNEERIDVDAAIEELIQCSLVDEFQSERDQERFVRTPLAASLFGVTRLKISPWRPAVEADLMLLQAFGAARPAEVRHGIEPRVQRLFQSVAEAAAAGRAILDDLLPTLEFVARKYPDAWLMLADLHEESGAEDSEASVRRCLEQYLINPMGSMSASRVWKRLADLERTSGDGLAELHALVEMAKTPDLPIPVLSSAANRVNGLLKQDYGRIVGRDDKTALLAELCDRMESRIDELDGDACSRLAWLYLNTGNAKRAEEVARRGLEKDPENYHCGGLMDRIQASHDATDGGAS